MRDEPFRALQDALREVLLDWLRALPEMDPDQFAEVLRAHHLHLKGACLESEALMQAIGGTARSSFSMWPAGGKPPRR